MTDWLKNIWNDERRIAPIRAVMHPAWLLAVAVLLVNDHIIKPWAVAEVFAGKASDFAGLFLFPVLLAALLGVSSRRGLWATGALTALVFGAINTIGPFAAAFDQLVSLAVPFTTTVDPTDLIALVAIPVGLVFFEPAMRRTDARRTRRALEFAAVTVGGVACMATSEPPCDECFDVTQSSQVSILNKTNELHILRIRTLRGGMQIDCDLVANDPSKYLVDGAFDAPQSWFVQSGQEIPVNPSNQFAFEGGADPEVGRECSAVLVESDTTPDIFIVWDTELPTKTYAFDADVPREIPADPQTVVLDADYSRTPEGEMHTWRERSDCGERADLCADDVLAPLARIPQGARYFWRSRHETDLHFPKPTTIESTLPTGDEMCQGPTAADSLVWEPPPSGELYVVGFDEGRDGCHELMLTADPEDPDRIPLSWWICAPAEALRPLVPDEPKRIIITTQNERATFSQGGYRGLEISVFTLAGVSGASLETIHLSRGYGLPDAIDFEPIFKPLEGCDPVEVECGQISLPTEVELGAYSETVRAGENVSVGEVQPLDIYIVRAEARPVVDTTCEVEQAQDLVPTSSGGTFIGYLETVVVRRNAGRE